MAENRYMKAAKATLKKHAPKTEINVMGQDPDGTRWVQTRDAPGYKKYLGDDIPGGTIERFGERSLTVLPPHGGGAEYQLRMGQHLDRPSKPPTEKPKEWGGHQAIMDLKYPEGVPEGRPIVPSEIRSFLDEEGMFDTYLDQGIDKVEPIPYEDNESDFYEELEALPLSEGMTAEEARKIDDQNQRDEIDAQIEDANFPDPRTDDAVRIAVEDMLAEQFVGLRLLEASKEHEDGVPDRIYFEAEDGSRWEWNSNGEIHRA